MLHICWDIFLSKIHFMTIMSFQSLMIMNMSSFDTKHAYFIIDFEMITTR
jgi:hypothetical protein